eukprot:CAMPEP_0114446198 /NCGR_PEP_ID=MMETSP0103-20121206/19081_1 /TAXON_ID=37642 ORGANISM="Paraphysomonas imperforata, Strain PA2" /NCGR_SAMPLE_ID=MMETSP0103 /ASSEMBLY_ACC=CAM_ASM_000201 /LENGTH=540 /DNA_ID=CAMNT_0001617965 /DNA_START=19 /DNA_END=1641 /DNA_ORIENTATION=+
MNPAVFRHLCVVATNLFTNEVITGDELSDTTSDISDQITQRVDALIQCINNILEIPEISSDEMATSAVLGLQRVLLSYPRDDAETCRTQFKNIGHCAADAFSASSVFQVQLICTKLSVLAALFLHSFFSQSLMERQQVITDMKVKLLSHLSTIFSQLVDTDDVRSAVAGEFEQRDMGTSIWLRLHHQTHTEVGQQILTDISHLQATLGSLFEGGLLVEHSFDVRNSHGAVVSLQIHRLRGHRGPITALAVTSTHLYSGSYDKAIIVWDLATHTQVGRLEGHDGHVRSLVVSPEEEMLYSACEAGVIASWDICIMSQSASVQRCHDCPITSLALSGGRLFSADDKGTLKAWDACMIGTPDHNELEWPSKQAHTHTITALAANATKLYSAGIFVKVWDSHTLTLLQKVKMHSGLTTALFLHGDTLYTGSRAIKVWNADTLERTSAPSLKKHSHSVTAIVVTRDGKRLYSAAHVIKEWDLTSGEEAISILREHTSDVSCLAISSNMLYSGSLDSNEIIYRAIEDTSVAEVECVRIEKHSDSIL